MSDADDQMGGTGGETGPPPEENRPSSGKEADRPDDQVTEESQDSFPASDPPANY